MKKTTTFSAYWYVENNPKPTNKLGHIKHAKDKNRLGQLGLDLDYFICSKNQPESFNHKINLELSDLPSSPYIKNLTNLCKSRDTVWFKLGWRIQSDIFLKLATIWTSKILLFQKILDYTDADYLMWVDCVKATRADLIASSDSDRCCVNKYWHGWPSKPFGGLLKYTIPHIKIMARVIRIPRHKLSEFIEKYIECLQFADNNFIIYDEEVVLTFMHEKYPQLFNLF